MGNVKLIRRLAESSSHPAILRVLGQRDIGTLSEEYFRGDCAKDGVVDSPIVAPLGHCFYGDVILDRVNLGRGTLHSRILEKVRGSRMLHMKSMDDLYSSEWNPLTLNHTHSLDVCSSFRLRLFLEPCCSRSLMESEPDVAAEDDPGVLRADSVKKKRKRKMNKHKLRKQRRLLRRKSH